MLVRTPHPEATESPFGYVLRLAEANGYPNPRIVLDYANFARQGRPISTLPLTNLVSVTGLPEPEIEAIAHTARDGEGRTRFKILGHDLGQHHSNLPLSLRDPVICPPCVVEHGYIDAFWDLEHAVACPIHGCRALSRCPSCGKSLSWFRPGLLTCACEADLSAANPEAASPDVLALMAAVRAKLHGEPLHDLPNDIGLPLAELDSISLRSILGILSALARFSLQSKGQSREGDRTAAAREAAECLAHFPTGFHQMLRRLGLQYKATSSGALGLRKQFEPFYLAIFKHSAFRKDAAFLRNAFVAFGQAEWGQAAMDPKLLKGMQRDAHSPRFLTLSQLAREKGIRPITLKRWADRGLITIHSINSANHVRHLVDDDTLDFGKKGPGRIMEGRKAAAFAGLPVSVLRGLRESGHYAVTHMPKHKHGYHEADLAAFRGKLFERACAVKTDAATGEAVSLGYVLQQMKFLRHDGKASFLAAFLEGTIDAIGMTGRDIAAIQFRRADVTKFISRSRLRPSNDALTQRDAALYLSCDSAAILELIRRGFISAVRVAGRIRVERNSLDTFAGKYLSLLAVANWGETSVGRLARLCRDSGIEVLSIARKNGKEVPFIFRTDEPKLLEHVGNHPTGKMQQELRARENPGVMPKLRAYLQSLDCSGAELPRRAGRPKIAAIATACGFDRGILYKNKEAVALLARWNEVEQRQHSQPVRAGLMDLRSYIEELEANGTLPRLRGGRINRCRLARQCGVHRNAIYKDKTIVELLARLDETQSAALGIRSDPAA
jgi:hypothetical protein